jgi:type VI secretion system protein ImpK
MTDAFAELVMPIFQKGIELQERLSRGEPRSLDEIKRAASEWVEDGRRRALAAPSLKRSYDLARFGLVAWIDEILTDSEWGRKVGSPEEILEWDHFSSRDRATLFYDHASLAEKEGDADALETYLLGVTLGFKGEFIHDDAQLADWVNHVYGRISAAETVPARPFADDPPMQGQFAPMRGPLLLLVVSILVSITAIVTLAAYLFAVHVECSSDNSNSAASPPSAFKNDQQLIRLPQDEEKRLACTRQRGEEGAS